MRRMRGMRGILNEKNEYLMRRMRGILNEKNERNT
jgi:hypothetical protein